MILDTLKRRVNPECNSWSTKVQGINVITLHYNVLVTVVWNINSISASYQQKREGALDVLIYLTRALFALKYTQTYVHVGPAAVKSDKHTVLVTSFQSTTKPDQQCTTDSPCT